jgi:hypothetical protein
MKSQSLPHTCVMTHGFCVRKITFSCNVGSKQWIQASDVEMVKNDTCSQWTHDIKITLRIVFFL